MRRTIIVVLVAAGLVGLGAVPAVGATGKPDAFIKKSGQDFIGKNVYTPPEPPEAQSVVAIVQGQFTVKVKNRGTQRDTITLKADGTLTNAASFAAEYKGDDVTDELEAGTLKLRRLDPGETSKTLTILENSGATGFAVVSIIATSRNKPGKSDSVRTETYCNNCI